MEEQFVPYELALKLKELGFDEPCLARYCIVTKWEEPTGEIKFQLIDIEPNVKYLVKTPLWQQAFDWFRDKHKLFGLNSPLLNNEWTIVIDDVNTSHQIYWSKIIGYEEARLKCLEKLIELVENKRL